jgi:hypothetical protein
MYRLRDQGWRWIWSGVLSAVVFVAVSTPWFVRNYRTFGRFMPFRDNFWYELWAGNTGDTSDLVPDWARPSNDEHQMRQFRTMGEIPYFDSKKPLVQKFIAEHHGTFAWVSFKRIVFTWTGFWSFDHNYMAGEPFEVPNTVFCTAVTILMLMGLLFAFRKEKSTGTFFAVVLFSIPLLYYITHPDLEYRHVIDPEVVILATFAVAHFARRRKECAVADRRLGSARKTWRGARRARHGRVLLRRFSGKRHGQLTGEQLRRKLSGPLRCFVNDDVPARYVGDWNLLPNRTSRLLDTWSRVGSLPFIECRSTSHDSASMGQLLQCL